MDGGLDTAARKPLRTKCRNSGCYWQYAIIYYQEYIAPTWGVMCSWYYHEHIATAKSASSSEISSLRHSCICEWCQPCILPYLYRRSSKDQLLMLESRSALRHFLWSCTAGCTALVSYRICIVLLLMDALMQQAKIDFVNLQIRHWTHALWPYLVFYSWHFPFQYSPVSVIGNSNAYYMSCAVVSTSLSWLHNGTDIVS